MFYFSDPNTLYSVCLPPGYRGGIAIGSSTQDVAAVTLTHEHNIHNICTVLITVYLDNVEERPKQQYPEVNKEQFYVLDKNLAHFIPKSKSTSSNF